MRGGFLRVTPPTQTGPGLHGPVGLLAGLLSRLVGTRALQGRVRAAAAGWLRGACVRGLWQRTAGEKHQTQHSGWLRGACVRGLWHRTAGERHQAQHRSPLAVSLAPAARVASQCCLYTTPSATATVIACCLPGQLPTLFSCLGHSVGRNPTIPLGALASAACDLLTVIASCLPGHLPTLFTCLENSWNPTILLGSLATAIASCLPCAVDRREPCTIPGPTVPRPAVLAPFPERVQRVDTAAD